LKTWQIIALTGTVVFLFAGIFPFVSAQFRGMPSSISLFDFYTLVAGSNSTGLLTNYTPQAIMAPPSVGLGLLVMMMLFPIVVIAGFVSVIRRPKATVLAGVLGVLCWLGSLFAVLQLQSLIPQQSALRALSVGSGVYIGISGAVILLASYFAAIREEGLSLPLHYLKHLSHFHSSLACAKPRFLNKMEFNENQEEKNMPTLNETESLEHIRLVKALVDYFKRVCLLLIRSTMNAMKIVAANPMSM
jgi:hypothetical protein